MALVATPRHPLRVLIPGLVAAIWLAGGPPAPWPAPAGPAAAAQRPAGEPKHRFAGQLRAGEAKTHAVAVRAGDYVRGHVEGAQLHVALLDATGAPKRVLATGRGERQEFQFVAGADESLGLQVRSPAGGAYVLAIDDLVPAAAQVAPPRVLDSPRLRKLESELKAGGTTDEFWTEAKARGTPLVETEGVIPPLGKGTALVTFLWRGARQGVRLFGAPSNDHDDLHRLGRSDVWFGSYRVPTTTRLDYKLAPDVPELSASPTVRRRAILATAQRDPLNPLGFPAGRPADAFTGVSVLELPDASNPVWLHKNPRTPAGTVSAHRVTSWLLKNTRDATLYRPAGYRAGAAANAVAVVFDGERYTDDIPTPTILDNLIAAGRIPPTAAVFVGNPSSDTRAAELPCNSTFTRFLAEELMPWAKEQGVHAPAGRTAVVGASYGGLAAAFTGFTRPDLFGIVVSQSGSFWWSPGAPAEPAGEPQWLTRQYAAAERKPVRFVLEAGTFEVGRREVGILDATRHLRDVLDAKGYQTRHSEYAGGHGYFNWRYTLPDALTAALGDLVAPAR
jgi:enterochelin esterase family protein